MILIFKFASWKAKKVIQLIKDSGFNKVQFYDDKSKIVNVVTKLVKSTLPNVDFTGNKV